MIDSLLRKVGPPVAPLFLIFLTFLLTAVRAEDLVVERGADRMTTEASKEAENADSWRVTGLSVGIDGCYKNGFPTTVKVYFERKSDGGSIENDAENASHSDTGPTENNANPAEVKDGSAKETSPADSLLRLETVDSDGTPTYYEKRVTLTGSKGSETFLFSSGREDAPLTLLICDPATGAVLAEKSWMPGTVDSPFETETSDSATDKTETADKTEMASQTKTMEKTPFTSDAASTKIDRSNLVTFPKPIGAERPIWLTLGGRGDGMAAMLNSLHLSEDRTPYLISAKNLDDLPTTAEGFAAVNLIILDASMPEFYAGATADHPVLTAIWDWIHRGGEAALFGGVGAIPLLKPGGILADLVPGTIPSESLGELRAAPTLVQYVPKAKNLVMLGSLDRPYLRFPVITPAADGVAIELAEGETPLLVKKTMGMGSILFLAPNPDELPLADWSGRSGLLMKMFADDIDSLTMGVRESGLIQRGYGDLSGQMRSALDRFDGVRNVPFSLVLILLLIFVLAIGPVDWLVTHRLLKRPNLTWVTLPIWFLLFGGLALGIGKSFRQESLRVNRVDLIDIDAATGRIRGASWTGLYSPVDFRRDLRLVPVLSDALKPTTAPEVRLSWLGLAGSGLGGMSSPIVTASPWSNGYRVDGGVLADFPVPVRSTKSLFGDWFAVTEARLTSKLTFQDEQLTGTLENPFGVPLENGILFFGGRAWLIGFLQPGETPLDVSTPSTDEVGRILTGTTNPFDGRMANSGGRVGGGWPKYFGGSTDPEAILRLMMFYRAAGGGKVTGLADAQHSRLDASSQGDRGAAVLVGRLRGFMDGASPAEVRTDLTVRDPATGDEGILASDAERKAGRLDHHAVYVRFFIPVEKIGKEKGDD